MIITLAAWKYNNQWYEIEGSQPNNGYPTYLCSSGLVRHGIVPQEILATCPKRFTLSLFLKSPRQAGFKKILLVKSSEYTCTASSDECPNVEVFLSSASRWIQENIASKMKGTELFVWVKLKSILQ